MKYRENYQNDLIKSRQTPLLIELNNKDLKNLDNNNGIDFAFFSAKAVYDKFLKDVKSTNVIYIDTDKKKNEISSILLEQIVEQIDDSLKKIYNLEIAKEGIKVGLSLVSSGISNLFGNYVDSGIEYISDNISNEINGQIADEVVTRIVKESASYSLDEIKSIVLESIKDKTTSKLDTLKNTQLYLSEDSKKLLLKNSKEFGKELSSAEQYQLILKIIVDIAVDMPIVLFIKNPHKLDENSLAILSLLLSVSKNLKDEGKHTGVSFVYAYEDEFFQPYQECEEKYKTNQNHLNEQRIFAQRYAMLERPSSDIPHISVKSYMFVGRRTELEILEKSYLASKANKRLATIQVVAADPGIGKTKLVKKHFEEIKEKEANGKQLIQLTLLNQIGHNSSNSGLGGLINSIIEEGQRLDRVKTLTQKGIDKVKNTSLNTVTSMIKDILDNNVLDTAKALNDRIKIDKKMLDFSKIDIENGKLFTAKEEQFEKINQVIKTLEGVADDAIPIVLFVDDLQWIDENSAEYIINHFIRKFNVHVVATLRSSDATTMLKEAIKKDTANVYKIALLEKVNVIVEKKKVASFSIDKLLLSSDRKFKSNRFELNGFDIKVLTQLIKQVIEGTTEQHKILGKIIIETLANSSKKDTVNTLFAVETLNMLSDDKFYKNNEKQLIMANNQNSKIPMKFNPDINNFSKLLKDTFKVLELNYKKAFNHPSNKDFTQNFNLMAYAVLEERLNILQVYFSEHGNAAVNTLLFSSLLGTPFNSNIVKKLLEELSNIDESEEVSPNDKKLLQPLKNYINKDNKETTLTTEHYEIIDEVYEILSRYIIFSHAYVYRHSLLNIFLDKQLEYTIDKLFIKSNMKSKSILFTLIIKNIISDEKENTPKVLEKDLYSLLEFYMISIGSVLSKVITNNIDIKNSEVLYDWFISIYNKLYLNGYYLILNKSLQLLIEIIEKEDTNLNQWKVKYFNILEKGVSLNDRLFNPDAVNYLEKMYTFINKLEESTENYILKGEFYYKIGGYKYLHVRYSEGLKDLFLSVKYLRLALESSSLSPSSFDEVNIILSFSYGRIGELLQRSSKSLLSSNEKKKHLEEALSYHNKSLEINRQIVDSYPMNDEYHRKLGVIYERIGQTYRDLKKNKEAEVNLLEAMKIKKCFYNKTEKSFSYRKILIVLSDFYLDTSNDEQAKKYIIMAVETIEEDSFKHDVKNLNQYLLESYLKTYTKLSKFKPNSQCLERISFLNTIVKQRGLNAEY